jgi:GDP-L-fucose synthase
MALNLYRGVRECCPDAAIVNPLSNCSYPGDAEVQVEGSWLSGPVHESVLSYGNSRRTIWVSSACFQRQYGLRSVNFLVPNTFGPGDSTDPNRTHALNGMIIRMLQAHRDGASEFEIWGTGSPVREWGYVEDVARVLVLGATGSEDLGYPVNIAQNRGYSIRESAEIIARHIGFEGRLVFNPEYTDGAPTKVLDDRRFRELFPDFEFTSHDEGVRRTIEYYDDVLWNGGEK